MHGAAFALTEAGGTPHNFFHHAANITALGNTVTVTTVGTANNVAVAKINTGSDRNGFLTVGGVHKTGHIAAHKFGDAAFFELANSSHGAIGSE